MSSFYSRGCVTVTHEPSGEVVKVDDSFGRSQYKKRQLAIQLMRSRLWAEQNGYGRSTKEVSVCDIPEAVNWWPNDFSDYREDMKNDVKA